MVRILSEVGRENATKATMQSLRQANRGLVEKVLGGWEERMCCGAELGVRSVGGKGDEL